MTTMYRFQAGSFLILATIETDTDVDTSFDETGETAEKLSSGEWEAFATDVRVIDKHGVIIGSSSLCGSIYADPREFFTDHRTSAPEFRNTWANNKGRSIHFNHYFPELVREAVGEAREHLKRMEREPSRNDPQQCNACGAYTNGPCGCID